MELTIKTGEPKGFAENMKSQKRWILSELDKRPDDVVAQRNLMGLLHLLDEIGDQLFEQSDLAEDEVFDMPREEE